MNFLGLIEKFVIDTVVTIAAAAVTFIDVLTVMSSDE